MHMYMTFRYALDHIRYKTPVIFLFQPKTESFSAFPGPPMSCTSRRRPGIKEKATRGHKMHALCGDAAKDYLLFD